MELLREQGARAGAAARKHKRTARQRVELQQRETQSVEQDERGGLHVEQQQRERQQGASQG
eukprot:680832-Rhodomonas_salina.1